MLRPTPPTLVFFGSKHQFAGEKSNLITERPGRPFLMFAQFGHLWRIFVRRPLETLLSPHPEIYLKELLCSLA